MTENDKRLIEAAKATSYRDWCDIDEDKADTDEAWRILHNIRTRLAHEEEGVAGML